MTDPSPGSPLTQRVHVAAKCIKISLRFLQLSKWAGISALVAVMLKELQLAVTARR